MQPRQLHAIQIKLRAPEWLSVIVWPFEPDNDRKFCRLINSNRTWLTCRTGDAVLLREWKATEWKRFYIERVELYRVFPVEFNGEDMVTAQGWMDGGV